MPGKRKMAVKPMVVNLDDERSQKVSRERERQNRRRDAMRQAQYRDLTEFEGAAVIISIDPGGTTGWSMMEVHPEALSDRPEHRNIGVIGNVLRWQHGQIDCGSKKGNRGTSLHAGISTAGESAGLGEILGLLRSWPEAAVVVEDFILDPKRFNTGRDLLSPVRLTSGINFDLWLQKRDYFVQSASLAKSTARDEQLKVWGYYTSTGGLQHARDADRHNLTFLKRASERSAKGRALRMAAWPHLFGKGKEFYNPGHTANRITMEGEGRVRALTENRERVEQEKNERRSELKKEA
ncbi:RuvC-like resolvase [Gordonia phage LittleFella]|nr:RuvC-like resolvase [Gordonia phage LittleFella]